MNLASRLSFSLVSSTISADPRRWINLSEPSVVFAAVLTLVVEMLNRPGAEEVVERLDCSELNSPGITVV